MRKTALLMCFAFHLSFCVGILCINCARFPFKRSWWGNDSAGDKCFISCGVFTAVYTPNKYDISWDLALNNVCPDPEACLQTTSSSIKSNWAPANSTLPPWRHACLFVPHYSFASADQRKTLLQWSRLSWRLTRQSSSHFLVPATAGASDQRGVPQCAVQINQAGILEMKNNLLWQESRSKLGVTSCGCFFPLSLLWV